MHLCYNVSFLNKMRYRKWATFSLYLVPIDLLVCPIYCLIFVCVKNTHLASIVEKCTDDIKVVGI